MAAGQRCWQAEPCDVDCRQGDLVLEDWRGICGFVLDHRPCAKLHRLLANDARPLPCGPSWLAIGRFVFVCLIEHRSLGPGFRAQGGAKCPIA
jgi:hypothetical protein